MAMVEKRLNHLNQDEFQEFVRQTLMRHAVTTLLSPPPPIRSVAQKEKEKILPSFHL